MEKTTVGIYKHNALKYWEMGYQPIPCKGKAPFLKNWTDFCRNPMEEKQVEDLAGQFPHMNIGLCMGLNVITIDVDTDDPRVVKAVENSIPMSPMSRRGKKGFASTYLYKGKDSHFRKVSDKGKVILEVLGEGRFVVVPPSIHPETKKPYMWADDIHPTDDLPEITDGDIKKMLSTVEALCVNAPAGNAVSGRNAALSKEAARLIHSRGSTDGNVKKLLDFDKKHHKPPFFSDQVDDPRNGPCPITNAYRFYFSIAQSIMDRRKREGKGIEIPLSMGSEEETGEHFYRIGKHGNPTKPDYPRLAKHVVDKYQIKTVEKMVYRWDGKRYEKTFEDNLNKIVMQETQDIAQPEHFNSIHKVIRAKSVIPQDTFVPPSGFLNLKNGVFELSTGKLHTHHSKRFFKSVVDVDYDPKVFPESFLTFLEDIMLGDEALMEVMQMFMGSVIMGGKPLIHKALVLFGEGRNGKSTFINIMRKLLGPENVSAVSMKNIDKPFSVVHLDGKLCNLVDETPSQAEVNAEAFKTAVAGGQLQAAYKGVDEFFLNVWCRFIFSCNDFPRFKDNTLGLNARLLMIPFDLTLEPKDFDYGLEDRIKAHEMPGVLNWAIDGYRMFVERGYTLPEPERSTEIKNEYMAEADTLFRWVDETIKVSREGADWTATDLFIEYKKWCQEEDVYPLSKPRFIRKLKNTMKKVYLKFHFNFKNSYVKVEGKTKYKSLIVRRTVGRSVWD